MPLRRLIVERLGAQGDGMAPTRDGPVYLPGSAPGDLVEAEVHATRRGPAVGKWRLITPSPQRADPVCPHYGVCGGCSLQHVDAALYARFLVDKIAAALSQQGLTADIADPVISPPHSRRRLIMTARRTGPSLVLGFHQARSHQLVQLSECPVAHPRLMVLVAPLRRLLKPLLSPGEQAGLTLTLTDSGTDLRLDMPAEPDLAAREALAAFADTEALAAISWAVDGVEEPVVRRREPLMRFGPAAVPLPAGAFVQATEDGERALTAVVLDSLAGVDKIADLFAGLGTFTFPLAERVPVLAVEGAASAVMALQTAARSTPGLKPVEAVHRDLFRRPLLAGEFIKIPAAVIDPPRAGAKAQCAELAASKLERVAAVSCNPATFARDARLLVDGGFSLGPITPVGQFLWSAHVELVCLLSR
ncbi:MAG: class I SAM-dependent RNA methyltransferase [Rhodothalassiaceae bacterium]